jgi:hypothetical protein
MTQIAEMSEPQRRHGIFVGGIGRGKSGEIAVGEGQYENVARHLAEIDRLDEIVECR